MNNPPWRWRWGQRGRGRPPKDRIIGFKSGRFSFVPFDVHGLPIPGEPIYLNPDELEALRLVYFEGLTQEEAAQRMGVSRGTLWRALDSGRRKLVQAIVEKRPLVFTTTERI
ncbi:MAG: DUF134 domain-containing protein [Thermoproteales archaeon]|nr:DUF134 domain-containing protein [Thermoproteales archaeon]RLE65758.1 MAG: hypothetical protein DRJ47_04290 [Thermoprotei archaeon]